MEISLVSALTGPQLGSFQLAVVAQLEQMNAQDTNSIAQLNAAAQENFAAAASTAANVGANLDVIA